MRKGEEMLKVTAKDIKGVVSMPPTPCKENAAGWNVENSIDIEKSVMLVNALLKSGVSAFAFCGTTGENAALLWEEKKEYIATTVRANNKRVPLFAGATSLGTKETIRQMRALRDVGADGAFLGLPLWQTPTMENSIQWYADLAEAVPDMSIMVYSNSMFFKSSFPTEFWEGLAKKAPTVVTNKIAYGIENLADDVRVSGHQIKFVPGNLSILEASKKTPGHCTANWTTGFAPEPLVAVMDAFNKGDTARVDEIVKDIRSVTPETPRDGFGGDPNLKGWTRDMSRGFASYNAQVHKWSWNNSGYMDIGPMRAPYRDLPDSWKATAAAHAKEWMVMREKYVKVVTSR